MRLQTPIFVTYSTSSFIWLNKKFSKKNQNCKLFWNKSIAPSILVCQTVLLWSFLLLKPFSVAFSPSNFFLPQSFLFYYLNREIIFDFFHNTMTFSHVMWEYLFLVCMVLLAVVLTFPKKSQIRRVVTTTPMLLRNIIKTRSVKNGLRPFIGEGGCHNKGGNCCSNKVTF